METWKDVPGYEGRYQVSDQGRVRNAAGRVLKPFAHRDGYLNVKLCAAGSERTVLVHRLVASAFLAPTPGCNEVDHLDCDKRNNRSVNLEWVDRSENMRRAALNGRLVLPDNTGERNGGARITAAAARAIRELAGTATHAQLGTRFGISRRAVGMILSRKRWANA
ncbi:NUMOD4 motif-containing HNH endonuclease [Burkholderia aenigmatica]|uniref:NUMOD4 motif-containing HNH endonuclease n=1 Tax=Burkholderia aenigmatica TaxID=2015348 RepID=UPI002652128B|nr:NUMOD4 motif-containing HNH endonuclease [Burkholderia aenigmatica]MDN7881380.1 NUMOD4 motif-containing HNH endonuclease [Burkholderia aenigmatica]